MNSRAKNTNNIFLSGLVITICVVGVMLYINPPAAAQTLGESVATMDIQQQLMSNEAKQRVVEPNLNKAAGENKEAAPKAAPAATAPAPAPAPAVTPKTKDVNTVKEPPKEAVTENAPDTNTPAPDANDFNEYKQELSRIDMDARNEDSRWMGRLDKKTDLLKAMDNVSTSELKFLRKLADSEGSKRTVEAIDLVLKKRQDRLTKLTTKLDDEAKTERRERRPPRMSNTGGGMGGMGGDQGQSNRPQRRTREPAQQTNTNTNNNNEDQP
jgi:hypothetical protein